MRPGCVQIEAAEFRYDNGTRENEETDQERNEIAARVWSRITSGVLYASFPSGLSSWCSVRRFGVSSLCSFWLLSSILALWTFSAYRAGRITPRCALPGWIPPQIPQYVISH